MSRFSYTPSIIQNQIWSPVPIEHNWSKGVSLLEAESGCEKEQTEVEFLEDVLRRIKSNIKEIQDTIDRRVEKLNETCEMDSLLNECHVARVNYTLRINKERLHKTRQQIKHNYNVIELEKKLFRKEQIRREKPREKILLREKKEKLRQEKREEKIRLREQERLEREAKIIQLSMEQRELIHQRARLFRQMKQDEEEAARKKEIADGWKVVTKKRTVKKSVSK